MLAIYGMPPETQTSSQFQIFPPAIVRNIKDFSRPITRMDGDYILKFVVWPKSFDEARPLALQKIQSKISSFSKFDQGWDGFDGVPANRQGVDDASAFLMQLPHSAAIPTPMLSSSGEIGLYWERGSKYAEVGFAGDGLYYFFSDFDGVIFPLDDIPLSTSAIPEIISTALVSI